MNKQPIRGQALRLVFFSLLALVFLLGARRFLVQTDSVTALTMQEMRKADDIQLAVVGSSIMRDHFNEALISEQTGLSAYAISAPNAGLQGLTAATRNLLSCHTPEWIVLVVEPYTFNTA